jgi:hypothetical protein
MFVYRDPDEAARPEQDATAARARGPFEPLRHEAEAEAPAGPGAPGPGAAGQPPEQTKDRYAAAEAIRDEHAGRHFNGLLRRQRELITDYFKGTGIAKPASFGAGDAVGADDSAEVGDQQVVVSEQQATD